MRLNYPFNISKVRNIVYYESVELLTQLHGDNFYILDPLISQIILYHIARADYIVLPKLKDRDSEFYFLYPSEVYTDYLHTLAKIRAIGIFYKHLME